MFPIRAVKQHFNLIGTSSEVIKEILDTRTSAQIKAFAFSHYLQTKQNIHLFSLNRNFVRAHISDDDFPFTISAEETINGVTTLGCLVRVEFVVIADNPPAREELHFFQPITFVFEGRQLRIHYTKLKKNVQAYYPENRAPRVLKIRHSENDSLKKIIGYLEEIYTVAPTDINIGIKEIWDNDEIDCRKLRWRDHHSFEITVMDEDETFKEAYPERYKEVAQAPIAASVFSYLLDDDYLCKIFGTDPSAGKINISKFPKTPDQISNVIGKILENN